MKEKIKQMGVWFKENFKTKKKHNLENLYELVHQEFNYDRMNLERTRIELERVKNYNGELLFRNNDLEEKLTKLKKENEKLKEKNEQFLEYLGKVAVLYDSNNRGITAIKKEIKEMQSGAWKVTAIKPRGKQPKTQEMKIKSSSRTSKIAKQMKGE